MLEARLRDDRGEGWDIHFSILRSYFQSGDDLMLHLNVVAVEPRSATRLAARAHLAELATARVLYAHSYERAELFDVRHNCRRACPVLLWKSRTSSATSVLRGVRPTPAMWASPS